MKDQYILLSSNGGQFVSQDFMTFPANSRTTHKTIASYYPNQGERYVHTIKCLNSMSGEQGTLLSTLSSLTITSIIQLYWNFFQPLFDIRLEVRTDPSLLKPETNIANSNEIVGFRRQLKPGECKQEIRAIERSNRALCVKKTRGLCTL